MSDVKKVIVLAAGKSLQLDGINKVLIKHPHDGRTVLDYIVEAFEGKEVTVVVGFSAIQIMQAYPKLNYVINPNWSLTNNAMSLGLALDENPTYVVPGDIFLNKKLIDRLDAQAENIALTRLTENRVLSSIHCVTDTSDNITDVYQGPVRSVNHPESTGIFKISDGAALREWKRRCTQHANLFAGQLIPNQIVPIKSVDTKDDVISEINTPVDYLNLMYQFQDIK